MNKMQIEDIFVYIRDITRQEKFALISKDSIFLYELLKQHKCLYLVKLWSTLQENNGFYGELASNYIKSKEEINFCKEIFNALNKLCISYAVFKGFVFSYSAYGSVAFRNSKDIDIVINPKDLTAVDNLLIDLGFRQGCFIEDEFVPANRAKEIFYLKFAHQTLPYVKKVSGKVVKYLMIDINFDLLWGEHMSKLDMDNVLKNVIPYELYGVEFFKLNTIYEFIAMCLHHYKDLNSIVQIYKNKYVLSVFCDIYFYLINNSFEPNELVAEASNLGVSDYVFFCIALAYEVFEDERLKPYITVLYSSEAESLLNRCGLTQDEYKTWKLTLVERLFLSTKKESFLEMLTHKDMDKIKFNLEMQN